MGLLDHESNDEESKQDNEPPFLENLGKSDDHQGKGGEFCAKVGEYRLELGNYLDQQNGGNDDGHHYYRDGVVHGLLDLGLQCLGLFLIGGNAVQQGLQGAGLFAGIHQIAVKLVEVFRFLA
ncbi:hypothetical protein D9M70_503200 [compost metagenome]